MEAECSCRELHEFSSLEECRFRLSYDLFIYFGPTAPSMNTSAIEKKNDRVTIFRSRQESL